MATQAEVDTAKSAMDSAKSALDSATASAKSYYDWMARCVSGKGNGKPLSSDNLVEFLEKGNAGDCVNESYTASCQHDCCSKGTCQSIINDYNSRVDTYETAQTNFDTAQSHYEELSGQVSQSGTDIGVSKIEEDAKAIRTRYYVFGGIAILLIVSAIVIYMVIRKK